MKLIVGLGNPGEKYQGNRHNVGFMFVDYLEKKIEGGRRKIDKYLDVEIAKITFKNEAIILAKPQTFMNESGHAVKKIINKLQLIMSNDLYVVHDDLDIRLGEYKIQKGKGPKLHNGIESIEQTLQTKDFWRVRIGVDNRDPEKRIHGEAYVLQDFTEEEREKIKHVFRSIVEGTLNTK